MKFLIKKEFTLIIIQNELNRIKALGVSKKQFLKLGKECKTLKEFKSNFSCKDSVINNCLLQWTGSFSFYKAFNKKLIAWNKKKIAWNKKNK